MNFGLFQKNDDLSIQFRKHGRLHVIQPPVFLLLLTQQQSAVPVIHWHPWSAPSVGWPAQRPVNKPQGIELKGEQELGGDASVNLVKNFETAS